MVDEWRSIVEEFNPLGVASAGSYTPTYSYVPNSRPIDVSVDHMRHVHVATNETGGPGPTLPVRIETFAYGVDESESYHATPDIVGLDARDLIRTRYSSSTGDVTSLTWDDVLLPDYYFSTYGLQTVPTVGTGTPKLGGLELQRIWRVLHSSGDEKVVHCDRRTYVADRADGKVHILHSKKTSTPRPDDTVAWWGSWTRTATRACSPPRRS